MGKNRTSNNQRSGQSRASDIRSSRRVDLYRFTQEDRPGSKSAASPETATWAIYETRYEVEVDPAQFSDQLSAAMSSHPSLLFLGVSVGDTGSAWSILSPFSGDWVRIKYKSDLDPDAAGLELSKILGLITGRNILNWLTDVIFSGTVSAVAAGAGAVGSAAATAAAGAVDAAGAIVDGAAGAAAHLPELAHGFLSAHKWTAIAVAVLGVSYLVWTAKGAIR